MVLLHLPPTPLLASRVLLVEHLTYGCGRDAPPLEPYGNGILVVNLMYGYAETEINANGSNAHKVMEGLRSFRPTIKRD